MGSPRSSAGPKRWFSSRLHQETQAPHDPYLTPEDSEKGTIESGKFADLTVLEQNPLALPPDQVKDVKVVSTLVGGRLVYDKV